MRCFLIISSVFLLATLASADKVKFLSNDPKLSAEENAEVEASEEKIAENNQRYRNGKSTELEKSNEWMDLSNEEFQKEREGGIVPENEAEERSFGGLIPEDPADRYDEESERYLARLTADRATPPSTWDSRDLGYVTPVKNQKQCGSCAAFSATAAMEACIMKATNKKSGVVDLSEQFMVDCGYNGKSMNGCNGAYIHGYQDYISKNHNELPHEYNDLYLNTEPNLVCDTTIPLFHAGATVTGRTYTYSCTDDELKRLIMAHGAVSTAVYASDDTFKNYGSGIISKCSSTQINHAVTAVGWDDSQGVWIVKNSWGTGWGEGGFFRMKMGVCGVGTVCAAVSCTVNGVTSAPVTTTPLPPRKECDIGKLYGNTGITGNYKLNTNMGDGNTYTALVTCKDSVCSANDANIENACVYICGRAEC